MSSRIFSTRNTTRTYLLVNMITTLILDGLIFWWLYDKAQAIYDSYWHRNQAGTLLYCAFLILIIALIQIIYHSIVSTTCVEVHAGGIRGTGMCKLQRQSFKLRWEQVVSLTTSTGSLLDSANPGMFVIVSTPAANYKIITSKKCAEEIMALYSGKDMQQQ